ncbi:hypothetical protein HW090_05625 [Pseudomonas sp. ABC1]|nr:hypothetical protein [Pseudomonas sp. ABC1]QLF92699.1 hypothetical protein HW090_05625 [Pseudomonas sp. ABC1]
MRRFVVCLLSERMTALPKGIFGEFKRDFAGFDPDGLDSLDGVVPFLPLG